LAFPGAKSQPVTRKWSAVSWFPIDENNHDYDDNPAAGGSALYSLLILLSAAAGSSFEVEFYGHYELIGLGAREVTPSWSSPKTDTFLDALNNFGSMIDIRSVQSALVEAGVNLGRNALGMAAQYGMDQVRNSRGPRIREISY
jgi:hypothetical protein